MTAAQLISKLGAAGIKLWLDDEQQLRFKAPKGAFTSELKNELIANKQAVIHFLQEASASSLKDTIPKLPRAASSRFNLSYAQQRFWFLDRLEPGNPSLHIPAALKIQGPLDIQLLEQSFNYLTQRHESLRTQFVVNDIHDVQQCIEDDATWELSENYDLSHLDGEVQQARIREIIEEEALRPFELTARADHHCHFLRARLARLSPSVADTAEHVLLITLHHIIADGWSVALLIRELTLVYQSLQQQQPVPLDPLRIHYVDFAHWQQQWMQSERMNQQLDYWRQQLAQVPVLELPTDFPRPKQSSIRGANINFALDSAISQQLRDTALAQNTSLFALLLGTFNVLMMRYSNQYDFCTGTPVANRNQQELEAIVGCFINLLAIRSQVQENLPFSTYLQQLQKTLLDAQANQAVPFELIADEVTDNRSMAHTPVFQVLFTMQNSAEDLAFNIQGLDIEYLPQESFTAKYDLQLHIDEGEVLSGSIEYNADLFQNETITALAEHFNCLLQSICNNPAQPLDQLNLLTAEEQHKLLATDSDSLNSTAFDFPCYQALQQIIEEQVERSPDAIALRYKEKTLSYRELNQQANQLAHQLIASGVGPDQIVATCLYRSMDMSVALLAILKAGAAYLPLDPDLPLERLRYMLDDAGVSILIGEESAEVFAELDCKQRLSMSSPVWQQQPQSNPPLRNQATDLFNVIYTSGSTGKPKGVMVPHQGIINRLQWMQKAYPINADDNLLQKTPYNFDVSVWELFWPLMQGSTLVYAKPFGHKDPQYLRDLIQREQISVLHFVPSMLGAFLQCDGIQHCKTIRQVFTSGEALQLEHNRTFFECLGFARLSNLYGPTEASIDVSFYDCHADEGARSVPIGKPIDNIQLHILSESLQPVPTGVTGELYIGGIGLARGYLNQPELTAETFIDNPFRQQGHPSSKLYKTGDLARYMPDGNIEYIGRSDHQIKLRGLRIELGEIESCLRAQDNIQDAIVHAVDIAGQKQLAAYLVSEQPLLDASEYRALLSQQLPDFMIPMVYVPLEHIPLSANGKVDRKQLPAVELESLHQQAYVAPRNVTESKLAIIWQELLGIEHIGIHDNFFELGGHSLTASKLISRISDEFGMELSLKDFFHQATIAEQHLAITEGGSLQQLNDQQNIPAADRSQPVPLSHAQERLWVIEQINPGNSAYNIPAALLLSGTLDVEALQQALTEVVRRHQSLRTRIVTLNDGTATQQLADVNAFSLAVEDLSSEHEAGALAQARFESEANRPFSLTGKPDSELLFRALLLKTAADEHVLIINMHHIISDGWSISILQKELVELYSVYQQQQVSPLPEPDIQYSDFAVWQRQHMQDDHIQHHLDFWTQTLKDTPAVIQLPTDRPRPQQQTFNGAMLSKELPADIGEALRKFTRQQGTTGFNVLLSLYVLLLNKYCHQQDICIGTPVAGRSHRQLQSLIGYFVNAVVVRNDLSGNPTLLELLERTQDTCLAAFAHQDVPIEQVLEALPLERNLSYPPVAQVGFSYIGQDFKVCTKLPELTVDYLDYERVVAKYELTFIVIDDGDSLQLNAEYNTDLFDTSTIERFLQHFCYLLQQGITQPDIPINLLSILDQTSLYEACEVTPEEVESIHPLTAMQRDMVMSQWLQPQTLANTLGYRAELDYEVDADYWQQAIDLFASKQSVARTRFAINRFGFGDLAYQCVYRNVDTQLEVFDYRDETLDEAVINARIHAFIYQPEQYGQGRFIRYGLMRLAANRTVLLLSSHHALLDGISIVLIAQTTASYYEALLADTDTDTLSDIPDNFSQYIEHNLTQVDKQPAQAFWQERLARCEGLDFRLAEKRDEDNHQRVLQHKLSPQHWADIKQYCRQYRMTPPQYFKLIYSLMIANYCGVEDDFYLTEFNAGRTREFAYSLGCYFEQSPFIFQQSLLQQDTQIKALFDYLRSFRKSIKGFTPVSAGLTQQLAPSGQLQFTYNYYHFFPLDQTMCGHPITCIEMPPYMDNTVQFVVKEYADHATFDLYYQSHSFNDLHLLERMELVSAQLLQGAETLSQISWLLPKEFIDQVYQWNTSRLEPLDHHSLQSQFEEQIARTPDAIAIHDDSTSISYSELNQRANRLAHYLHHLGVGSDVRVGVCMHRCIDAMVAILATIKAGGAYVPIEASYPQQRIDYMLGEAHIHVLLTQSHLAHLSQHFDGDTICLDDDPVHQPLIEQQPVDNPIDHTDKHDLLYVIFTSGSTGQPKGATVTHRGELNLQRWYLKTFDFSEQTRCLVISALGFDLTQKNLFAPLLSGGQLILTAMPHYDSNQVRALIEKHQVTLINCAPSAFYPLVEDHTDYQPLNSLKQLIFGGEKINVSRIADWLQGDDCQTQLINNYGPTECTDIASFYRVENVTEAVQMEIPIGKPNDNVQLYILNNMQQLLPTGLTGEIAVGGKGVGRGYLNNETLNRQKFIPNPYGEGQLYLTGDLGFYQADGNLQFVNRKDFQVKLHGQRLELGEIEHLLKQQEDVNDALLSVNDNRLIAYLLADKNTDTQLLRVKLQQKLPDYMLPHSFIILSQWPLTANGKIDREALPEPDINSTRVAYAPPRDDIEQTICNIVERVLDIQQVGIHDNFFDLGGHSLAASRAIVQIREHFQIDIPMNVLFDLTTAEKLAEYIKASQWATQAAQQTDNGDTGRDTGFI